MNFLIAYATTEGHTATLAEHCATTLRREGYEAEVVDTKHIDPDFDIDAFDAYLLLGSLHQTKHQASLVGFIHRNLTRLNEAPSALISASATGSKVDPLSQAKANACIDELLDETDWRPLARTPIGGCIQYTKYNFFIRLVMKRISEQEGGPTDTSRDHELTDWDKLDRFVKNFASAAESQCRGIRSQVEVSLR